MNIQLNLPLTSRKLEKTPYLAEYIHLSVQFCLIKYINFDSEVWSSLNASDVKKGIFWLVFNIHPPKK